MANDEKLNFLANNIYNAAIRELAQAGFDTFGDEKLNKKLRKLSYEFVEKLMENFKVGINGKNL